MNPQILTSSRPPDAPTIATSHGIDWLTLLLMVAIALWGGVVSYLRYLAKGAQFSFWFCIWHIFSAGFAGFCVALLCQDNHVSMPLTGVACAISGHMGAELIKILEDRLRARSKGLAP